MGSTKIINVLKGDSFSEILDIFKGTAADEVIFVLPKQSRAFQKNEHFALLKEEADQLGKSVSFLCSNSDLNALAKNNGFDVLLARSPASPSTKTNKKSRPPISMVNEIEDFYEKPAIKEHADAEEADFAVAPVEEEVEAVTASARRMDDVVQPTTRDQRNVKVAARPEKSAPVAVHHDTDFESFESRALSEIQSIWRPDAATSAPSKTKAPRKSLFSLFKRSPKQPTQKQWRSSSSGMSRSKRLWIALGTAVIIIVGVVVFVTTGSAEVTLTPQSQTLPVVFTVSASNTVSAVDSANGEIPGQLFTIQKTVSQNFPTTGHEDVAQKARGTITVYDELTTSQQLIATTRFESADGHIFRSLTGTVVPAATTQNGKLIPGQSDVQVIADQAGADYNLPAGAFTIPAFQEQGDADKYQHVYGQSDAAMAGGTSGQANVMTQSDYNGAQAALTTALQSSVSDELKSEIDGLTVISDTASASASNVSATATVNEAADNFTMTMAGGLKTVGFKESDLDTLIQQYVAAKYQLNAIPSKLTLSYSNISFNSTTNALEFTVTATGPLYANIDQSQLISGLLGLNTAQISAYLKGIAGISAANVALHPLWVQSVPRDPKRVHIIINY